jgi:hypothetical protein
VCKVDSANLTSSREACICSVISVYFLTTVTKVRSFFFIFSYSTVNGMSSGLRFLVGEVSFTALLKRSAILAFVDGGSGDAPVLLVESNREGDRGSTGIGFLCSLITVDVVLRLSQSSLAFTSSKKIGLLAQEATLLPCLVRERFVVVCLIFFQVFCPFAQCLNRSGHRVIC